MEEQPSTSASAATKDAEPTGTRAKVMLLLNTRQASLERDASNGDSGSGGLHARRAMRSLSCKSRMGCSPPKSPCAASTGSSPLRCISIRPASLSVPTTPKSYSIRGSQSTKVRRRPPGCALCGDRWCFELECCPLIPPLVRPVAHAPRMRRPQLYDQILLHGWYPGQETASGQQVGHPHPMLAGYASRVDGSGKGAQALGADGMLMTAEEAAKLEVRKEQELLEAVAEAGSNAPPSMVKKLVTGIQSREQSRPGSAAPCSTSGSRQGAPIVGIVSGRGTPTLRGDAHRWVLHNEGIQSVPVSRPSSAQGQHGLAGQHDSQSLQRAAVTAFMRRTAPSAAMDAYQGAPTGGATTPATTSPAAAGRPAAWTAGAAGAAATRPHTSPASAASHPSLRPQPARSNPLRPTQPVEIVHTKPRAVATSDGGLSIKAVSKQEIGTSTRDRYYRALRQPLGLNHPALRPPTTHLYPHRPSSSGRPSAVALDLDIDLNADRPPPSVQIKMHLPPSSPQLGPGYGGRVQSGASEAASVSSHASSGTLSAPPARQALLSSMWKNLAQVQNSCHGTTLSRAAGRSAVPADAPVAYRGCTGTLLAVPTCAQHRR